MIYLALTTLLFLFLLTKNRGHMDLDTVVMLFLYSYVPLVNIFTVSALLLGTYVAEKHYDE